MAHWYKLLLRRLFRIECEALPSSLYSNLNACFDQMFSTGSLRHFHMSMGLTLTPAIYPDGSGTTPDNRGLCGVFPPTK